MTQEKDGVRSFTTGATRSAEGDKFDYEGFLSPLVIERFGAYMHKHRKQADGTLRASDNWQKGMPISAYIKSLFRHFVTSWSLHRQYWQQEFAIITPETYGEQEDNLCAILFNAQGALHEILKHKRANLAKDRIVLESKEDLAQVVSLTQQIEDRRRLQDKLDAVEFAVKTAEPPTGSCVYGFEGMAYRESGECRPPKQGEVYVSHTRSPVRASSDYTPAHMFKILIPAHKL